MERKEFTKEELANQIYELHIQYTKAVTELKIADVEQITKLAAIQKAILVKSMHLARAVLDAKVPKVPELSKVYGELE